MKWKIGDVVCLKSSKWDPMTVSQTGITADGNFSRECSRSYGEATVEAVRGPNVGGYSVVAGLSHSFFHEDMLAKYEESQNPGDIQKAAAQ